MEPTELPPLPILNKKRKGKSGKRGNGPMNRSRSFVAEMFHINQNNPSMLPNKKWSDNDMKLMEKMGISPQRKANDSDREKLQISGDLHPDLKQHAYEEQISSLSTELQQTKNNLMRAAEYGQHLIEENQRLEGVVLELRNEAAEYIAQLCELREENERMKAEAQGNEYSVNDYQHKEFEYKQEKEDLEHKILVLTNELTDIKLKYEMEMNKSKVFKDEHEKHLSNTNELSEKHSAEVDALQTKILVLQNTNHSLVMDKQELQSKHDHVRQQKTLLENEYNELVNHIKSQDAASQDGDSQHRFEISRRGSPSRSRSHKREELDEKMDEIMHDLKQSPSRGNRSHSGSDSEDNEYKFDHQHSSKYQQYAPLLSQCMHLFECIVDDQHVETPTSLKTPSMTLKPPGDDAGTRHEHHDQHEIDVEVFKDLLDSVRKKLFHEKVDVQKRNISELRRFSKSANSNMVETLDAYIASTDDDEHRADVHVHDHHDADNHDKHNESNDENEREETYEADNEDLDHLASKKVEIEPIDENKKKCVDQFLMRYSEENAWQRRPRKVDDNDNEYDIEIEFHESINLENKKKNHIAIRSSLLQSLTNLIENIMGIDSTPDRGSYFSVCGWFCGKHTDEASNYSSHYLNILSTLDYQKTNREEIYWVIYQLLNIIYKYYNHTNNGDDAKHTVKIEREENVSDSESASMVMTQSKSKYAELKPPRRRRRHKVMGGGISSKVKGNEKTKGSFKALTADDSSSDNSQQ